ncbi:MAG: DNA-processing protein DprA [Gemmatimonadota bacterium]|nr:DNA-processing protein DprA [Gemmatimonadota bacterium]
MSRPVGASPKETRALLLLDQLPGVGPRRIRALVEAFGSAQGTLNAPHGTVAAMVGDQAARERANPAHRERVDTGLAEAERLAMRTCSWFDPTYPGGLLQLADPPPVLFLRGRIELLDRGGVSVVGSRRCTGRGKNLAHALGRALGGAGAPVVSGMALGIDAAAHRGTLAARGDTIAVVGRGADAPYPTSHGRLFRELLERGLVVSEFLPGTPPLPHHFPRRNRIMAALADTVVVVEAGARSGALITVEHALDLGRDVWAVPGPIDTPSCAGSNQLLTEGALPLVSVKSFVERVADLSAAPAGRRADAEETGGDSAEVTICDERTGTTCTVERPLDEPERRILRTLGEGPLHVDELAARAEIDVPVALALLVQLELVGAVEQMPGLLFRAA